MKIRPKAYLKLNLVSLFMIAVSFISVTLAWFAYSGLAKVSTEVNVKAWYIELEKNGQKVSNDVVISLSEIYPGMEPLDEIIKIKNLGDSDAEVKYSIVSARILGNSENNYITNEVTTSETIEDLLSHNFPFGINIDLTKNYVLSNGDESVFEISISWPLDSANDELDSLWGTKAFDFNKSEEEKSLNDINYQEQPSIQIEISLTAEQYLAIGTSSDLKYNLGDEILIDVINNKTCTALSETCLKTYVLDENNTLADTVVNLLPNPYSTYLTVPYNDYENALNTMTNTWVVNKRGLSVTDLMKIVSTDIQNSILIRENLSDSIIGNLKYNNRIETKLLDATNYNGYYKFMNERFSFLPSSGCYWTNTEYNLFQGFALKKIDNDTSKIYGNLKENTCKVIPVITMEKTKLNK